MTTGTPPTYFCSVTRAELFGPAPLSASAFSLCTIAGGVSAPGDCSMGGLAPANTLVPPRVIATEPISRLFISARQWEEFSLDLIVGFLKVVKRSALRKARSVAAFDARRNFSSRNQISLYAPPIRATSPLLVRQARCQQRRFGTAGGISRSSNCPTTQ